MKINKETTIELTNKDIETIICEHIEKQGYNISKIKFNAIEKVTRDPVDSRFDTTTLTLDGCTITCCE